MNQVASGGPTHQLHVEWEEHMRMGQLAFGLGNYKEAKRQFEKALDLSGPNDARLGITLLNLAVSYSAAGRDDLAEPLFQKALRIDEQNLPCNCRDLAVDFIDVGAHYARMADYGRAEQMYERALSILERKSESGKDADIALALNNLGLVYLELGEHEKAETALQRALDIRQRIFVKDSKEVAESLINLANLKNSIGMNDEADALYQRAIAILEMRVGPDHPELADALQAYADFLRDVGRCSQADAAAKRAEQILSRHDII